MNMTKKHIDWPALKIKHALENKGVRQSDLARKLGVTTTTMYKVLYQSMVSDRVRRAIAEIIGKDVSEIWPSYYLKGPRRPL